MYPYIQASSEDHSDAVYASPHSNFCATTAVLQGLHCRVSNSLLCGSQGTKLNQVTRSLQVIFVSNGNIIFHS